MGLREQNAARARESMIGAAVELFLGVGYDATTMEDIAQKAQVGSSTLYRYFDSKDSLLLAPLGPPGLMADSLRHAAADRALDLALGDAVTALLSFPRSAVVSDERYHLLITSNPKVQSKLLEWYREEERLLVEAIAHKQGASANEPHVVLAARTTMLVLELANRDTAADAGEAATTARAREVMRELAGRHTVVPRTDSTA